MLHVPYRGAAPATNDLLAGTVDIDAARHLGLLPHVRSGAVKALAVTSDTRSPLLPDVPTMRELGLPKVNSDNWYALISPGEAPPADARRSMPPPSRPCKQGGRSTPMPPSAVSWSAARRRS